MDFAAADYEYGGGKPSYQPSGDGTHFFASLAKQGGSGGPLKLIVWHVGANGQIISAWGDSGIIGQGGIELGGDGVLYAVGYTAYGDNAATRSVPVPGWKPWAVQQGPAGPRGLPGPQGPAGPKGDPGPPGPAGGGDAAQAKLDAIRAIVEA